MDVEFKLEGFHEIERKLERVPYEVAHSALRAGLQAGAEVWRQGLAERVRRGWHHWARGKRGAHSPGSEIAARPAVFGYLHEHEAMRVTVESDEIAGIARVGPAKEGFWARFLEFGTRHMPAYPFLRPTFEATAQQVIAAFGGAIRAALNRSAGGK